MIATASGVFGVFRRVSPCRAERAPREPKARDLIAHGGAADKSVLKTCPRLRRRRRRSSRAAQAQRRAGVMAAAASRPRSAVGAITATPCAAIRESWDRIHRVRPLAVPGVLAKSVAGPAVLWDSIRRTAPRALSSLYVSSIKNPGTPERIEIPRYLPRTEPRTGGVNPGPDPGPSQPDHQKGERGTLNVISSPKNAASIR